MRLMPLFGPAATVVLLMLSASTVFAQAFLPSKGEAYASVLFTNMYVNRHLFTFEEMDQGEIDANTMLFDVTYGLTDRLTVSLGLPLVVSRYRGAFPHQPDNPDRLDDGTWNAAFQDFRFNVRFNAVRRGSFAVTPFIGTAVPSHSYDHWAHSAPGANLRQLQMGVTAARLLDELVPGLFVQGRYSFGVSERAADIRPLRSNADVELGYFLSPELRVFGMAAAQRGHSGIDIRRGVPLSTVHRAQHDRISRDEFLNLGVGASWSLTERMDIYGAVHKQIAGRNGHKLNRAISVGVSWNLRRAPLPSVVQAPPSAANPMAAESAPAAPAKTAADEAPRKSLLRCLCQKG